MIKYILCVFSICLAMSCSKAGEPVPAFNLKTLDGKSISEADLKGKIVVIDVWATWCINCINELNDLNQLAEKYAQDPDVLLLAVSDETEDKVRKFLRKRPYNFTHIPNGLSLTDALQSRLVKTYPQHIVLDKASKVSYDSSGEMANASEVLSREIEQLR